MRSVTFALLLACGAACAKPNTTPTPPATKRATMGVFGPSGPIANASVTLTTCASASVQTTATNGTTTFTLPYACAGSATVVVTASGYTTTTQSVQLPSGDGIFNPANIVLTLSVPPVPSRAAVASARLCFQGLTFQSQQFGSLPWYEVALSSLNPTDRAALYAQKLAANCPAAIVSLVWDYGETGQAYGSGQLVPPTDFRGNPAAFRALAEEVIQAGLTPIYFLGCDFGYATCLANIPIAVQALQPQANDPVDLIPYGVLFPCFDSCIPAWQPPSQIDDIDLAMRAAAPNAIIGQAEYVPGYASWWQGASDYTRLAGQAIDVVYSEFPSWPSTGSWEAPARMIPPGQYVWPPDEPADYDTRTPPFYLAPGTPRGPYVYHCFEYDTYPWVHEQITDAAVVAAGRAYYVAMGCPVVD